MSREHTKEEIRSKILGHIRMLVDYWEHESRTISTKDKLEGVAFSILTMLDGESSLPAFAIVPMPHPNDKEYHINNGENYYPYYGNVAGDVGGGLHDEFYNRNK